jgi:hypothetical protein
MESLDEKIQRANNLLNLARNIEKFESDYEDAEEEGGCSTLHVILEGPNKNIDVRATVIDIVEEALLLAEEVGLDIFEKKEKKKEVLNVG